LSTTPLLAIVDDDLAVREALRDLLEVEGFAARTFASAAELLADGARGNFACIVTDVRMPGIDGLQLQQRLRAVGSAVPMIFITSSHDEASRTRAFRDGALAWFTKPVADEALLRAVRTAVAEGPGD
jgi:FixJ family two-component response regulator